MALLIPFKFLQFLDSTSCAMHNRIAVVLSEWTILDICECAPSLMEFFIQANLIQEAWWEPRMLMEPKIRMSTWIYLETALFILTQLARYKLMHYWGNI